MPEMSNFNIYEAIRKFEDNTKNFVISYGDDETLLDTIRTNPKKSIIPVRSRGFLCDEHAGFLQRLCDGELKKSLKYVKFPFLELQYGKIVREAVSEFTVKSQNPSKPICFNVSINGTEYVRNCAADGVVFSSEMGSHGYWKSVARSILRGDICGLGFINPSCDIANIILKPTDKVTVEMSRESAVVVSFDSLSEDFSAFLGQTFEFSETCDGSSVFGYDVFMCPECRKNRNITTPCNTHLT